MTPKEYRIKTGQTQRQAAIEFGVTGTTWYRWERAGKFSKANEGLAEYKLKEREVE